MWGERELEVAGVNREPQRSPTRVRPSRKRTAPARLCSASRYVRSATSSALPASAAAASYAAVAALSRARSTSACSCAWGVGGGSARSGTATGVSEMSGHAHGRGSRGWRGRAAPPTHVVVVAPQGGLRAAQRVGVGRQRRCALHQTLIVVGRLQQVRQQAAGRAYARRQRARGWSAARPAARKRLDAPARSGSPLLTAVPAAWSLGSAPHRLRRSPAQPAAPRARPPWWGPWENGGLAVGVSCVRREIHNMETILVQHARLVAVCLC